MPEVAVPSPVRRKEPTRYISLTERGRERLITRGGLDHLNSGISPEAVRIIRDTVQKFFREQASDNYSI
jgi:hypothetical protein